MTTYDNDLTAFQRDLLWTVAGIEPDYGLAIKREMESLYGDTVHHGRLYPNLDDLVDAGLLTKSALDDRTNEYALTADGREMLQLRRSWEADQMGDDQ